MKQRKHWIIFSVFLISIENFYHDYLLLHEVFTMSEWVIFVLNNRFVILIILGIPMVIINYGIVCSIFKNEYLLLRYGNYKRVIRESMYAIAKNALGMIIGFAGLTVVVAIAGGHFDFTCYNLEEVKRFADLLCNLFLFDITIGCAEMLLVVFGCKDKMVAGIVIAMLLLNIGISGSSLFLEKIMGSLSWIGNAMVLETGTSDVHLVYWGICIAGCVGICHVKLLISFRFMKLGYKYVEWILTCTIGFAIFILYEKTFSQYADNLLEYFWGFDRFNIYVFLYLLYQLPIWILSYLFLTRRIKVFLVQYLIRGKKISQYLAELFGKFFLMNILYYGIGILVLLVMLEQIINVEMVLVLVNILFQNVILILVAFLIWTFDMEERQLGFITVLTLHLVLGGICGNISKYAWAIPLTGGLYGSHRLEQGKTCIMQLVYMIVVLVTAYLLFAYKYEKLSYKKIEEHI